MNLRIKTEVKDKPVQSGNGLVNPKVLNIKNLKIKPLR